jgi:tetratricopeptide (TPR) repeat protein
MTSDAGEGLRDLLAQLGAAREARNWRLLLDQADLAVALIDVARPVGGSPLDVLLAGVSDFGAVAARELNDRDRVRYFVDVMIAAGRRLGPSPELAHSLGWRALLHEMEGRLAAAAADYAAALEMLRTVEHSPQVEHTLRVNYAELLATRGEQATAREVLAPVGSAPPSTVANPILAERRELAVSATLATLGRDVATLTAVYQRALAAGDRLAAGVVASNIGDELLGRGETREAAAYLRTAVEILGEIGEDQHYAVACLNLGLVRLAEGDDPLDLFKRAWGILRVVDPASPRALAALYVLASHRFRLLDPDRARAALDHGLSIYEGVRPQLAVREAEHSATLGIYRLMLELRIVIAVADGWMDQAADFVERGKARFWSESIAARGDGSDPGALQPELVRAGDTGPFAVMLNYFVGPHLTFVAGGRPGWPQVRIIPLPETEVRQTVGRVIGALLRKAPIEEVDPERVRLGTLLVQDVDLSGAQSVLVFPDGPLWALPFEVLPVPGGDAGLGDLAPVVTAPSLRVLGQLRRNGAEPLPPAEWHVVALGDPDAAGLPPVPETRRQVDRLQRLSGTVTPLVGPDATRRNLLCHAGTATHLHIAAHAFAGSVDAVPHIVLGDGRGGPDRLYEHEIARLDLTAELVFLSACSTNAGPQSDGEGLVSIARAFIFAGARCVIAAPWPIPAEQATQLVDDFYTELETGVAVARAARTARRKAQVRGSSARVWASLQVIGDGLGADDQIEMIKKYGGR